jgi:hypothetical protein
MTCSPAPASVSLPPPRAKKLPGSPKAARETVEAPTQSHQVDIELLLARVTIRGVAGVSSAAVAEYVAILQRDLAASTRLVRLNAPTLPAPACIDDAVLDIVNAHDPETCTDPCCVPEDDDATHYCADEGHVVLSDAHGLYGVSSMGGW